MLIACMRSAKDDDTVRPILLTLYQATDVTVQNIKMINGPEWINFVRSDFVTVSVRRLVGRGALSFS